MNSSFFNPQFTTLWKIEVVVSKRLVSCEQDIEIIFLKQRFTFLFKNYFYITVQVLISFQMLLLYKTEKAFFPILLLFLLSPLRSMKEVEQWFNQRQLYFPRIEVI